jgi:hypothetical protein
MSEPAGAGRDRSSGVLSQEEVRRNQALVGLTLNLRKLDLSSFIREVARRIREVLGVEFCEVLERLADKDRMSLRAAADTALEPRTEPTRCFEWAAPLRDRDIVSSISTLICANGCIYGILGAYSTSQRRYTEEEVGFLQNAAE